MGKFRIYTTGGTLVEPQEGEAGPEEEVIDEIGVAPPWQTFYFDPTAGLVLHLFTARHRREGAGKRVNNYYASYHDLNARPDELLAELAKRVHKLWTHSDSRWEPVHDDHEAGDPEWIKKLASIDTEPTTFREKAIADYLKKGGNRLALGFSSRESALEAVRQFDETGRTIIFADDAKIATFDDVGLIIEVGGNEDFNPLDKKTKKRVQTATEQYQEQLTRSVINQTETNLSELSKTSSTEKLKRGEAVRVLLAAEAEIERSSPRMEPETELGKNKVRQICDPVLEASKQLDSEWDQKLRDGVQEKLLNSLVKIRLALLESVISYFKDQLARISSARLSPEEKTNILRTAKEIIRTGSAGQQKSTNGRIQQFTKVTEASKFVTKNQWLSTQEEILDLLDDHIDTFATKILDNASNDLQGRIDDKIDSLVKNTGGTEEVIRHEFANKISIAPSRKGRLKNAVTDSLPGSGTNSRLGSNINSQVKVAARDFELNLEQSILPKLIDQTGKTESEIRTKLAEETTIQKDSLSKRSFDSASSKRGMEESSERLGAQQSSLWGNITLIFPIAFVLGVILLAFGAAFMIIGIPPFTGEEQPSEIELQEPSDGATISQTDFFVNGSSSESSVQVVVTNTSGEQRNSSASVHNESFSHKITSISPGEYEVTVFAPENKAKRQKSANVTVDSTRSPSSTETPMNEIGASVTSTGTDAAFGES